MANLMNMDYTFSTLTFPHTKVRVGALNAFVFTYIDEQLNESSLVH